jgi:hypothetical protein
VRFIRLGPGRIDINIEMVRIGGPLAADDTIFRSEGGAVLYTTPWMGPGYFRLVRGSGEVGDLRFATIFREQQLLNTLAANGWVVRHGPR